MKSMGKSNAETYQLDLRRYELRRADGVKIKLERQPMELLIFLAEKIGQLVTRDEVAARLWPNDISVDIAPAINNAIRKIRTALHDSPETPRYLETVVGKGYRLIGDLEVIGAPPPVESKMIPLLVPSPQQVSRMQRRRFRMAMAGIAVALIVAGSLGFELWRSSWRTHYPAIHSLAVLPLQNLSGDPAQAYLADGMTDELITNLAKISSLRVISRTSTMQYAEHKKTMAQIVKELNVDAVVEGSVVRSGSRVRITAQLIDARRDSHLWAQSYERDLGEILELQDSVALDIASQVKGNLSPEERGTLISHHQIGPEAYEAYLRGRNEIAKQTQDGMRKSTQYFQRAIELDPVYAAGYAGLADSFSLMANYGVLPPKEVFPRAEAAARKALDLDPSSAEAHASLGFARHHYDWDWPGAEADYKRALQLSPGLALAHLRYAEYLSNSGRHDEAIREINRARELDPLSLTIDNNVGRILFFSRRYDDAIREMRSILSLHPDRIFVRVFLAKAYDQKHMYPEAIAEFNRATGGDPGVGQAHAYAASGQADVAKRVLREHAEVPSATGTLDYVFIAGVYAALGDNERAFVWLERASENRDFFITYLKVDPDLDPLRSDQRFGRFLKSVGIP